MPREDFFRVLDSLAPHIDPADFAVVITGGEPLMRTDLEECGREIKKRGYPWGMVTNGLGLTPERYTRLLNAGLKSLTISLDGLEENHNLFRGNPHSFERAVRAINMAAHTDGITFDVMTCVNRKNLKELPSIFNLLLNLGVKRWRVSNVFPKGRAKDNPLFMLSNDEFRQVFEFIREAKSKKLMNVNYDCDRHARACGAITSRGISIRMIFGMYGRIAIRSCGTAAGLKLANAAIASIGAIAKAPAYISATRKPKN